MLAEQEVIEKVSVQMQPRVVAMPGRRPAFFNVADAKNTVRHFRRRFLVTPERWLRGDLHELAEELIGMREIPPGEYVVRQPMRAHDYYDVRRVTDGEETLVIRLFAASSREEA